jgi:hypothetical protein
MYWGLMYGLIAGFVLFILFMLSRFITVLWFPVFLVGLIWGGYRNYIKQKKEAGHGNTEPKTVLEEFKEAAKDIVGATREMVAEQVEEAAQREEMAAQEIIENDELAPTEVETDNREEESFVAGAAEEPVAPVVPSDNQPFAPQPPTAEDKGTENQPPRPPIDQPKVPPV